MSATTPAPKTPAVAIARALRGLGLTQGRGCDFRVTGDYRNGERVGTYVLVLTRHASEVIAEHADEIEAQTSTGFPFRVSVRYFGTSRPVASVANYGDRIRETPATPEPATTPKPEEAAPTPAPTETDVEPAQAETEPTPEALAAAPAPAPELPPAGTTAARFFEGAQQRQLNRRRADALGWSERQAHLIAMANTAGLSFDKEGILRDRPRPGWPGVRVDEARLAPLVKAGFIAVFEPYGPGYRRVSTTQDGRDALFLWNVYRPAPVVKDRQEERAPLRPLIGGRHAALRDHAAAEDARRRATEAEAMYAAIEELHAWEELCDVRWKAWAKVQGITHRLGRQAPAGWMPTEEEIAEHRLTPDTVAILRGEAKRPTPRPALPKVTPMRPLEVPLLPAAPPSAEQLGLFAEAV
ncbi:hypothetical protein ACFY0N_00570 [Streptomyces vinaceus]|uniref:hypothetical protein n=1 Tax=Streptomyces vinaceus TaxID=1960 RepID=UPI00369713DD